ncbi:hypothetical protein [Niabella sp.]|uniref:hypothetical protein n=1 Tax=Niabella sp. TaxID=1962976 RepID=UPI002609228B|nr:hypothetical protein [Niabella sp.]
MNQILKQHYFTLLKIWQEYEKLNVQTSAHLLRLFHLASATLLNYLPSIGYKDHDYIFKKILFNQKLSLLEQGMPELLHAVRYENKLSALNLLKSAPSIICTFHIGSYRLINLFLAENKIPFSLVVSKTVIEKQGESIQQAFCSSNSLRQMHLDLIDAEQPAAGLQMIKALKSGKSLVVYVDGNTGAGTSSISNENCCEINFLSHKIFVRKGVGFLSHAAKVPVLPVICYRKSLTSVNIRFFDPIYPDTDMDRGTFPSKLMQQVYNLAGFYIEKYPQQWEAWLYLYKVAVLNQRSSQISTPPFQLPKALTFNEKWYGLYQFNRQNYIFDKKDLLSYKIQPQLYALLNKMQKQPTKSKTIDVILLQDLYNKGVLIAS